MDAESLQSLKITVKLVADAKEAIQTVDKALGELQQKVQKFNQTSKDQMALPGMEKVKKDIDSVKEPMDNVTEKAENMASRFRTISVSLAFVSYGLNQLRTIINGVVDSITGFASTFAKMFGEVEEATARMQVAMGTSSQTANSLSKAFMLLSMEVPTTQAELLKIAETLNKAGIEGVGATYEITKLVAKLSELEPALGVEEIAEALSVIRSSFRLQLEDMDNIASVMYKIAKQTVGGLDDYTAGLARAAPAAQAINISFEDMAAMLGVIIQVTNQAEQSGTRFKRLLVSLRQNIEEIAEQMGMTREAALNMLGEDAVGFLTKYAETVKASGDELGFLSEVFDQRAIDAILPLINNLDLMTEYLEDARNEWSKLNNETELTKDYAVVTKTFNAEMQKLKNILDGLKTVIGEAIVPYLTKGIVLLQNLAKYAIALWVSLSPEAKKWIVVILGVIVVIGALSVAFITLTTVAIAAMMTVAGLVALFGSVAGAAIAVAAAVMIAVGAILWLIATALGLSIALPRINVGDKFKEWLGLDKLQENLTKVDKTLKKKFDDINTTVTESSGEMGKALANYGALLAQWGNTFLGKYVYQFERADWELLDSVTKIAEQHFAILEKAGTLSAEQAVLALEMVRGKIGQAIYEMKTLGKVTGETITAIQESVGGARAESILKQIVQAIKVEELQNAIEKITDKLGNLKDAMKEAIDKINDQIEAIEESYEAQIKPHQDIIDTLTKQKKELEKVYKQEKKIYDAQVKEAQKQYDFEKDRYDEIRDINKAEMDVLREQEDMAREQLSDAQDTLDALKELRQKDIDAAEGMLDYARMNLESAQNRLKKEKIIGKTEWDASYRAALTRVESAEQQVDLAYGVYISTKNSHDEQIELAQQTVDAQKAAVEALQDQIKALQKAHKEEEKYYEQLVDTAKDQLDTAKDALSDFKDNYQEQADLLNEQIDAQKEMVDALKEARDEEIQILKEEKGAIEDRYKAEMDVLEAKKKSAEKALKKEEQYLETLERLNQEYINAINNRMQAIEQEISGMDISVPIPEPDISEWDTSKWSIDDIKINFKLPDFASMATNIGDKLLEAIKKIPTPFEIGEKVGEWISDIDWKQVKKDIKKAIKKIDWSTVVETLVTLAFPPLIGLKSFKKCFEVDWSQIITDIDTSLKEGDWEIVETILGLMFPFGTFLLGVLSKLGVSSDFSWDKDVKAALVKVIKGVAWGDAITEIFSSLSNKVSEKINEAKLWGEDIVDKFKDGVSGKKELIKSQGTIIGQTLKTGLDYATNSARSWGIAAINNYGSGIDAKKESVKTKGQQVATKLKGGLDYAINNAWSWGGDFAKNFKNGMEAKKKELENAVKGIAEAIAKYLMFSLPEEGPLSTMDEWMPHMIDNLASGIKGGLPKLEGTVKDMASVLAGVATPDFAGINANAMGTSIQSEASRGQVGGKTEVIFNVGNMIATEGEKREFAREISSYATTELQRLGK